MMRKKFTRKMVSCILAGCMVFTMAVPMNVQAAKKQPKLNFKAITMVIGGTKKLKVKGVSKKQVKKVTWKTNKKKIVKVNKTGKLFALKEGKAKITCKVKLKTGKNYTLKCKVKVTAEVPMEPQDQIVTPDYSSAPSGTSTPVIEQTQNPVSSSDVTGGNESDATQTTAPGGNESDATQTTAPGGNEGDATQTTAPGGNESDTTQTTAPGGNESDTTQTTAPGGNESDITQTDAPSGSDAPSTQTESPEATQRPSTPTGTPATSVMPETTPVGAHLSKNGITTIDNGVMREEMTAFQMVHNMGLGINLGNTLESVGVTWIQNPGITDYETAWGAPVTTQEMITGMKEAGFNSIRIPVAWSNMMDESDGEYTISEDYFNRVEEIMNYAFNERMYVIINIHFDGGWWARFGSLDSIEREEAMKKYKAMWTQIANRYKEYSDYLIFESANEELGHRLNSTEDYAGSGYFTTTDQLYEMTNEINQTFVDIVRGTGGNNAVRHLLIAGYDTDIEKTCDSRYIMPTDTVFSKLMVSIHYYTPATYCLVDDVNNEWGYDATWGTEDDIAAMKSDLEKMKICFSNKGYPVIIGEYGVCDTKVDADTYVRKEGRDIFIETICEYAASNGMCPVLWSTPGHIYDRTTCKIENETEAALYLELAEHAENNPIFVPATAKTELVWNGTVGSDSDWNPIAPVSGENCDFIMTSYGGCYAISGVDWMAYDTPSLELSFSSSQGSLGYKLSTAITGNQDWGYIGDGQIKISGTWSTSSTLQIDMSALNLTGKETVYLRLDGCDFSGVLTMTVSGKQ